MTRPQSPCAATVTALPRGLRPLTARLAALHVPQLLCGAVSHPLATLLVTPGIAVTSGVAGKVVDVLREISSGKLRLPAPEAPRGGCHVLRAPRRRAARRRDGR